MQLVTAAYSTGGITHPKIIITPAFIQDFRCRTRLGRKSRKSKVKDKYKSKSRVKLNISLVKSLTAVADRPTVYVRVTPPCSNSRRASLLRPRPSTAFIDIKYYIVPCKQTEKQ